MLEKMAPETKEFAVKFSEYMDVVKEDPLENFIQNPQFMDFDPTPAQSVALKCVFGQELDPIEPCYVWMEQPIEDDSFVLEKVMMTEVELYRFMTDQDYLPELQTERNRINLIVGRRGGKTTLAAMLALYCAVKINWKPYLKKTPTATVAILSHSREFSDEVLEIIKQFVNESPILSKLIDKTKKHTQSIFHLKVPFYVDGKVEYSYVRIKVGAASKRTIRGSAICALLCDEIAFWNLDENAAERDEDILRAARPALMQFGDHSLLIKLSSPGLKQGILYNEYQRRNDEENPLPENFINLKAPSWVWNNILEAKEFQKEYQLDPTGFDSEYRANFVDSISNFIIPEFVDLCVMRGQTFQTPEPKGSDVVYCAALDAAFKGDRFAFTLLGWDGVKMKQYVMKTWKGSRKEPTKAATVAEFARNICKEYGIARVYADQYSFNPLKEIFEQYGVTLEECVFTNTFKKKIYLNLKKLIHNQNLDLLDHEINVKEIKQLQVEQTNTGTVRIGHPPGGTDDCSDATAIAGFLLTENINSMGLAEAEVAGENYDIRTDASGRAFDAPSPEMLSEQYGYQIIDNSGLYEFDEETGEIVRKEDDEDPEGGSDGGADFIM